MSHGNSNSRRKTPPKPPAWRDDSLARIDFHGAAGKVTGSCYLLSTHDTRVLIDCGMHQGGKQDRALNSAKWPFDPQHLDAVVLTHAHLDHCGLLPRLVAEGFRGKVHATCGTCDLAEIILRDAAHIQESDAKHKSRRLQRAGRPPAVPLYVMRDAELALEQLEPHEFGEFITLAEDLRVRFHPAAHILGASHVEFRIRDVKAERSVVFSGDIGRVGQPVVPDPQPPQGADLVIMESTYGDRDHRDGAATLDELADSLSRAERSGGNVIVPVFAVGRAQELLHAIAMLEQEGRVPRRETVLDSPMAINVTDLYTRNPSCLGETTRARLQGEVPALMPARLRSTRHWTESAELNERQGLTILSASGMCDAGRIQHHLKHNLWRTDAQILIVGYQAEGSLGRALVNGAKSVRVMGEEVRVKASIRTLGGFSAHAGRSELLAWIEGTGEPRARVVLTHGEPSQTAAFAEELERVRGEAPIVPELGDRLFIPRSGRAFELESRRR
ncbi:MAG: MBL fold metallo-hydrolase [Planctomycetota bacterium]|nr:MAG: MBL fold metallo-hydrolase [Planctomycetota bacterium]